MYEMTSKPFVRRTRATFRSAEFGFLGVVVYTRVQTPRFCGLDLSAGALSLASTIFRPCRMSWLMVGITLELENTLNLHRHRDRPIGACPGATPIRGRPANVEGTPG